MNERTVVINEALTFVVTENCYTPVNKAKQRIREEAEKNHWSIREMGHGSMIYAPVVVGEMKYEPVILGESTIPNRATKRVDRILKSGVFPQGILIGYEVEIDTKPKTKPLPWVVPQMPPTGVPEPKPARKPLKVPKIDIDIDWEMVGKVALITAAVAVGVVAFVYILPLLLGVVFLAAGCGTDPSIVIVIGGEGEESEWIEIYRDYD